MAELSQKERLQPSLLDRLTDDDPAAKQEPREKRVLNIQRLRESVVRDLGWLLNTAHLEASVPLDGYPFVARSTLNYGLPDITGRTASSVDVGDLEKMIRQCIRDFEPRILPESIKVKVQVDGGKMGPNALTFLIEGELWAQPVPVRLYLKTDLDLETGSMTVNHVS